MKNVLVVLLLCFAVLGGSSGEDPLKVVAFAGLPVILPCHQRLPQNTEVPTIEWSKDGLRPSSYVFVYRQNFEVYEEKHPDYEFRTNLFMKLLQHGTFSMRLSDVRKADAGRYFCKTIWSKAQQETKIIELVVVDIPTPKISVVSLESGTVDLSCEVSSCSQEPRLTFLDGDRNVLKAEEPKITPDDSTGCYRVEIRATAPTGVKSVVCRVEFAETNQSRETHMLMLEENRESCIVYIIMAGTSFVVLILLVLGWLIKFCCNSAKTQKSEKKVERQPTEESDASESQRLLKPQDESFTAVDIPDGQEQEQEQPRTPQTQEPDLISSTSISIHSKADGKTGSVLDFFPNAIANGSCDEIDAKPATCEINDASKPVKFKNKLTRQNANAIVDCVLPPEVSPHSPPDLANGVKVASPRKCPVVRSRSVSDSYPVPSPFDIKSHYRRHSISGSMRKFQTLQEEKPEHFSSERL